MSKDTRLIIGECVADFSGPSESEARACKRHVVRCVNLVADLGAEFPGLVNGEDEVCGSDLVAFLSRHLNQEVGS